MHKDLARYTLYVAARSFIMVDAVSSSLTGLYNASARVAQASENIANASVAGSNVDVAKEVVDQQIASVNYAANIQMLKAEFENQKKLLDILA
jgi:flagellar basal body rod protein FlgC